MTIGKHDFVRAAVELIHFPGDAGVWCERQGIDADALMEFMDGFVRTLMQQRSESFITDDHDDAVEALAAFCSAFSVGFELGRQYPSTPFEQ